MTNSPELDISLPFTVTNTFAVVAPAGTLMAREVGEASIISVMAVFPIRMVFSAATLLKPDPLIVIVLPIHTVSELKPVMAGPASLLSSFLLQENKLNSAAISIAVSSGRLMIISFIVGTDF